MNGLVLIAPSLEGFQLATGGSANAKRAYWKELIYCGRFEKGELSFTVTPTTHDPKRNVFSLAHWEGTGRRMLANGVCIPCPIEHTTDPTKKRAEIVEYARRRNALGKMALFGKYEFVDAQAERELKSAGVSIYVPTSEPVSDGLGNRYEYPITHVAFTDYPVIPGLEKFAIAASFTESDKTDGESTMSKLMDFAANQLGLPTDGKDDDSIVDDIAAFFGQMKNDLTALQDSLSSDDSGGGEEVKAPDDTGNRTEGSGDAATPSAVEKTDEEKAADEEKKKEDEAVKASLVKITRQNRALQLGQLLNGGYITPAQHKQLSTDYCNDKALSLAFGSKGLEHQGAFDKLIGILASNKPQVVYGGQTGPQSSTNGLPLALSKPYGQGDGNEDVMIKEAEKRAAGKR